ncbi:MAG TPA: hypothetical protein VFB30_18095, partial [Spirochaetia bacterium]|nr:hypothetical protein [Spirochaetia bacterium]
WSARKLRDGRIVALSVDEKVGAADDGQGSKTEVVLLSDRGKVLSRFALEGRVHPWVRLTVLRNGHLLVPVCLFPVCDGAKVVELTFKGEQVWECAVPKKFVKFLNCEGTIKTCAMDQSVFCAARLPNGHTLLAMPDESKVVEVDRDGKVVHELKIEGRPWHIQVVR